MLKFSSVFIAVMLHAAVLSGANGADVSDEMAMLVGNTLTAVTWVPHSAAAPGGGALSRFIFQAYLRQNGVALIRVWDAARNAYTRPVERNWGLYGSRLCLDLPAPGPGRICAEFIAGVRELLASALLLTSCWMVISNLGMRFSRRADTRFQ